MSSSIEKLKQKFINERYSLLRSTRVPLNGFVEDTLPYPGKNGEVIFKRALMLKRAWSTEQYRHKIDESTRSKEDRENCQVVVIPPRNPNNKNKDFSQAFFQNLKESQLGKYPAAYLKRQSYHDDKGDKGRFIIGKRNVKTVYIVSSLVDSSDIEDIQHAASEYRLYGNDVQVNLVSPFIKSERDDKNVESIGKNSTKKYSGKIVSILSTMRALAPFVDNIFTYETHSSATQAFAAMFGIDLIPFSLHEELLEQIRDRIIKRSDWRVVRPDIGRNMIARRLATILKIKGVSLSKFRKGDTLASESMPLTKEETKLLSDKNVILYDDEGATFGTVKDIVLNHLIKAKVKSINILLGHARLQKGWKKNLKKMIEECKKEGIPLEIYITDSRVPIGDLDSFITRYKNIKKVSVVDKTRKIIEAAINGINFFENKEWGGVDWENLILQPIPGYDFKENNHK